MRRRLKIGAVNVCVNPEEVFSGGNAASDAKKSMLSSILTKSQCGKGFVNNIVLTPPIEVGKGSREEWRVKKAKVREPEAD